MRRLRWRRLFVVVAVMALVAAACDGDDDEAEEVETEEGAPEQEEQEQEFEGTVITATEYEFEAPDELEASTVTVRGDNDGNVAHEFAFFKVGDRDPEEFFADFKEVAGGEEPVPIPDYFFEGFSGMGTAQPDESVESTFTLTEGNWLLFCSLDDSATEGADEGGGGGGDEQSAGRAQEEEEEAQLPPHFELGMFQEITVTGDAEPTPPEGFPTVTARDFTFDIPALEAGEQEIAVLNAGPREAHHAILFEAGEGVAPADAEAQFRQLLAGEGGGGGEEEPAGRAQEEEGGGEPPTVAESTVFSPGYGGTITVDLEGGQTYLFACFIPERDGGPPHAIGQDMFKAFAVS